MSQELGLLRAQLNLIQQTLNVVLEKLDRLEEDKKEREELKKCVVALTKAQKKSNSIGKSPERLVFGEKFGHGFWENIAKNGMKRGKNFVRRKNAVKNAKKWRQKFWEAKNFKNRGFVLKIHCNSKILCSINFKNLRRFQKKF
jgi:hypothetical protein